MVQELAMHRLLQHRHALKATINNQKFIDLPKMGLVIEAVREKKQLEAHLCSSS